MLKKYMLPIIAFLLTLGAIPQWSFFQALDNLLLDSYFVIRGERELPENVLFVYLDEEDISSLGGWPLSRDYWGYAIHQATKAGARAVAIDVFFATENELFAEYDKSLVEITAASSNVILPLVINSLPGKNEIEKMEVITPFPGLNEAAKATGFANLGDEPTIRNVPVQIKQDSLVFNSFGLVLAQEMGVDSTREFNELLPPSSSMQINFAGFAKTVHGISFVAFLHALRTDAAELELQGKLVLIAPVAPGLPIVRRTPFADAVPASFIHLNVAENILKQNYLQSLPWFLRALIIISLCLLAWLILAKNERQPPYFWPLFIVSIYIVLSCYFFVFQLTIIPVFWPVTGFLLFFIAGYRQKENQVKSALSLRTKLLKKEINQAQQRVAAAETEMFEIKKQRLAEQQKNSETSQENELAIIEKQKKVIELEKQLRDLQAFDEPESGQKASFKIANLIYAPDSPMAEVVNLVQKISDDDIPVLIQGETGTGKEVLAQAIHAQSRRKNKPFIAVNCGALSESLLESELFGHEKGAFTGAQNLRRGRFELADGGTIFLDEITETSPAFQARLLRVLQDGTLERLGGERSIKIDVRCIAASNQDIKKQVDEGKFRADLYYRLNGFPIDIPPLRQREVDIPVLVRHFLDKHDYRELKISKAALDNLCFYAWPGNVRELENTVRRMGLLAKSEHNSIIQQEHLPEEILTSGGEKGSGVDYKPFEEQVLHALRKFEFSRSAISETARFLGNKDRGTITEYYRGLCFQFLVENENDYAKSAAALAGTNDTEIIQRVQNKLESYLSNLDPTQKDPGHAQYKGLPKKFHPALDAVLDYLAEKRDV
ncbi:MAG: CHASE2 domain-containing protein [Calditrichaeota bacterium]|nr:MAG: CHASE2 domain-containing protein [Calditrichota bacterium]